MIIHSQPRTRCRPPPAWLAGGAALAAVAALLVAVGVLGQAAATASAALAWTATRSPDALISPDGMQAVSCPNTGFCAAVGGGIQIEPGALPLRDGEPEAHSWTPGHAWTVQQQLPSPASAAYTTFTAIACTSARFCLAVGHYAAPGAGNTTLLADRWNGSSWTTVLHSGAGALLAVSCSAWNACTAVGATDGFIAGAMSNGIADRWNGARWAAQSVPPNTNDDGVYFTGVACPSARICLATGFEANLGQGAIPIADIDNGPTQPVAERWNGSTWIVQTVPAAITFNGAAGPPYGSISCPAASYCLAATGDQTSAWDGTAWTLSPATPAAGGAFAGVSCRSATWCAGVGSVSPAAGGSPTLAERWNGTGWTSQPTAGDARGAQPNVLRSLSCPSSASCEAVGTAGSGVLATQWNGTGWVLQDPPEPAGAAASSFAAVSRPGAADCVAVGSATPAGGTAAGLAEAWDGAAWTVLPAPPAATGLTGVSCPAAGVCIAVGTGAAGPVIDSWDGTAWTQQTAAAGPATLTAVSCPAADDCLAVGSTAAGKAAAESWDGASWTALPVPAGRALAAISCPAADSCTAVGAADTIDHWNGTAWSAEHAAPAAAVLAGVSCVSVRNCFAVGAYQRGTLTTPELIEHWNGTAWSLKYPPVPGGSTTTALRAVACRSWRWCMAAGYYRDTYATVLTLTDRYS